MGVDFLTLSTRIGECYARVGWYLPVHPSLHRYALAHLEYDVPFDPREAVRRIAPGSRHWSWIVEGTLASPTLESRAAVVEDAVFCLENERWHASVSTLLPVIERVVSDRSGVLQDMRVGRRVDHMLHTQSGP